MKNLLVAGLAIAALYFFLEAQKSKENQKEETDVVPPINNNNEIIDVVDKKVIFPPEIQKEYNTEKWATVSPINIKIVRK